MWRRHHSVRGIGGRTTCTRTVGMTHYPHPYFSTGFKPLPKASIFPVSKQRALEPLAELRCPIIELHADVRDRVSGVIHVARPDGEHTAKNQAHDTYPPHQRAATGRAE